MRPVTVKIWNAAATRTNPAQFRTEQGIFHQWGLELFEETEGPSSSFTVGIVELLDGTVHAVIPDRIKFNVPETQGDQRKESSL